ncbi:hypothetical protein [Paenibacillus periandrae]|uniref:hypothetical protein n=1 Tax=Paenibacillus periandrae TaxID=1761741 RepID=UPI001F093BC9|nr:hypothetical protein [Paenibacillus periandrae]
MSITISIHNTNNPVKESSSKGEEKKAVYDYQLGTGSAVSLKYWVYSKGMAKVV